MSTVHAEVPHHSEVQTTAGPAAGITVQTQQYIDNAFIQHPKKFLQQIPNKIVNIYVPLIQPKTKDPQIE